MAATVFGQVTRRVTVIVAALAFGIGTASAATAAPPPEGARYIALGDSYAAVGGLAPSAPGSAEDCGQTVNNYAHIVAEAKGYELTDVSCGGAKTKDMYERQKEWTPPQLDALTADAELVTVMIGGNDSDVFGGTVENCIKATFQLPIIDAPCTHRIGEAPITTVREVTYPAVKQVLTSIREKAPAARVLIVGYPWLVPAQGECLPQMPVLASDMPYFRRLQSELNGAAARAAEETGAEFIDMAAASEGHDPCKPPGARMVEPILLTDHPVPLHPNAYGQQAMASQILAHL